MEPTAAMLEPVSPKTYDTIRTLTRHERVAGHDITYCPCRVLPETVLSLKAIMRDVERLWRESLGETAFETIRTHSEGARFFSGEARITSVQEGRPDMVSVWLPIPHDYPRRLRVQLVDAVEPFEFP